MYYGDKRKAKVNLYHALIAKGWTCYGYKADKSDSMTDYYSPAYWDGIASKNGLTLVVDNYSNKTTEAKEVYKTEYTPVNSDIYEKIEKVKTLAERGATEGEKAAARNMIENLNDKLNKESKKIEASKKLLYTIPAYSQHPTKRTLWHLEKDGIILAKGANLFTLYYLPDWYDLDTLTVNYTYHERYKQWETDYATGESVKIFTDEKIKEFYTPNENQEKAIKLLNKIIKEVEKHAKEFKTITIGDGTSKTEEEGKTRGYKKVIKTRVKKVMKIIELTKVNDMMNAKYFMLKVDFNYGCRKGYIYKIGASKWGQSERLNGKLTKTLTGTSNTANHFTANIDSLNKWLVKGAIIAVDIQEVKEVEEYTTLVKDDYKAPTEPKQEKKQTAKNKTSYNSEQTITCQVNYNEEKNGIELSFNSKPSEEIRKKLKANGFRWSRPKKLWYAKNTEERMGFAKTLSATYNGDQETASKDDITGKETEHAQTEPKKQTYHNRMSEEGKKIIDDIINEDEPQREKTKVKEVIHNKDKNGLEIYFTDDVGYIMKQILKDKKFRYHKAKDMYYARYNKELEEFANSLEKAG